MPSKDGVWYDLAKKVKKTNSNRTRRPCFKSGNHEEVTTLYGKLKEGTTSQRPEKGGHKRHVSSLGGIT